MNQTTEIFPRGLGQRRTDAEYCNPISGPRGGKHNAPVYWVAGILILLLIPTIVHLWK